MTSKKIVIAICTPSTVVSRSLLMSLIMTFMLDPAKLQMNWASARGMSALRNALAGGTDFLGVETEVVGERAHLLKRQPRLLESLRASQCADVPERADGERSLRATEPIGRGARIVAVDKAVGDQLLIHGAQC